MNHSIQIATHGIRKFYFRPLLALAACFYACAGVATTTALPDTPAGKLGGILKAIEEKAEKAGAGEPALLPVLVRDRRRRLRLSPDRLRAAGRARQPGPARAERGAAAGTRS